LCCSLCNIVSSIFSNKISKEIEHVKDGIQTAPEYFYDQEMQFYWSTIGYRLLAAAFALTGQYLIFMPLMNDLNWIPFIGFLLQKLEAQAVLAIAMVTTATLQFLVISIAWLFYKPLFAMAMSLMAGLGTYMVFYWDTLSV